MEREQIKNKIIQHLKEKVAWLEQNPNQSQQFQLGSLDALFPNSGEPFWQRNKTISIVLEIMHEFENNGIIHEGQPNLYGDSTTYPWFTITTYGVEVLQQENWLPYDPEGYIKAIRTKIPNLDDITLAYIGEAVSAYNRRNLLSATITLGVASENIMLDLIEVYADWITDPERKKKFKIAIEDKFIARQYKEFKREFVLDIKTFSKDTQANWETYLDGVFNFIRLNRNDAGHPTGKKFDVKVVYANLQIFAEYAEFIYKLMMELK